MIGTILKRVPTDQKIKALAAMASVSQDDLIATDVAIAKVGAHPLIAVVLGRQFSGLADVVDRLQDCYKYNQSFLPSIKKGVIDGALVQVLGLRAYSTILKLAAVVYNIDYDGQTSIAEVIHEARKDYLHSCVECDHFWKPNAVRPSYSWLLDGSTIWSWLEDHVLGRMLLSLEQDLVDRYPNVVPLIPSVRALIEGVERGETTPLATAVHHAMKPQGARYLAEALGHVARMYGYVDEYTAWVVEEATAAPYVDIVYDSPVVFMRDVLIPRAESLLILAQDPTVYEACPSCGELQAVGCSL